MVKKETVVGGRRASGRTFRSLLHAFIHASHGKTVIFMTSHATHAFRVGLRVVDALLSDDFIKRKSNETIAFINGGQIIFTSGKNPERLAGIKGVTIHD